METRAVPQESLRFDQACGFRLQAEVEPRPSIFRLKPEATGEAGSHG
jgi:hypothetical protein